MFPRDAVYGLWCEVVTLELRVHRAVTALRDRRASRADVAVGRPRAAGRGPGRMAESGLAAAGESEDEEWLRAYC